MKYTIKTTKTFDKQMKRCEKCGLNMRLIKEACCCWPTRERCLLSIARTNW
ncbi:MAG: hypothetical protein IJL35_09465 [Bacteroidaceae bacterium]|nr:hypothetical protein [Bacteroidaceae bacterium]